MKKRSKKTLQIATKVFVRLLLSTILCAILYVSMNVISNGLLSNIVGYQVFEQSDGQTVTIVEEHYYQPGEVVLEAADLDLEKNQMFTNIRVVPEGTQRIMDILSQVLMLILLGVFPYHILWEFGHRDDTNVRFHGQRADALRGIKIGLLAMTPYYLCTVLLIVSKYIHALGSVLSIYRLISFPYLPYLNWLTGDATTASDVALGRLLLIFPILMIIPFICGIAYRMGGQQFSIMEFITFSRKKSESQEEEI